MDRLCPYLLSEDGTYRSTEPDDSHRCTAQHPPGTLPLAFQERFCLTDRHVRCEMYKFALESAAAAGDGGLVPVDGGHGKAPQAAGVGRSAGSGSTESRRSVVLALVGILAIVGVIVALVLLFGGGGGPVVPPDASGSPAAATGDPAAATSPPTGPPDTTPTQAPQTSADATEPAATGETTAEVLVRYEVQEDERLLAIAEKFGTTRPRIIRANEGMADRQPYVVAGDEILVPASAAMTAEQLEAIPGYLGPAE